MNGVSRAGRALRACLAGGLVVVLSGCAGWTPSVLDRGLAPLTQAVHADGPVLRFEFELGDDAGADDAVLGGGYIVVSQEGREVQALPHAFEMAEQRRLGCCGIARLQRRDDGVMLAPVMVAPENGTRRAAPHSVCKCT